MDLYIYSDESGVFDKAHNEIFVYGGLIFLGKKEKDGYNRKYITAEKTIRCGRYSQGVELKACRISNKEKGKLYRSLNQIIRFGIVINQRNVLDRYLDYAYKVGLKKTMQRLIKEEKIKAEEIETIHIYNDEHRVIILRFK